MKDTEAEMLSNFQINSSPSSSSGPKLSDILFERRIQTFSNFISVGSNIEAVDDCMLFGAGLQNQVAILGGSGLGKSHLLSATAARISQERSRPEIYCATDFEHVLPKLEHANPLILDNVQEVLSRPRQRQELGRVLERRCRAGKANLLAFTMTSANRQLKQFLPNSRDWATPVMKAPVAAERILLVNELGEAENLVLSPKLTKILALHLYGSVNTISGALKRMRLSQRCWKTTPDALKACGVLSPFFVANPTWDITLTVKRTLDGYRGDLSQVRKRDLAMFLLLKKAAIAEVEIARFYEATPVQVHNAVGRIEAKLQAFEFSEEVLDELIHLIVESLVSE